MNFYQFASTTKTKEKPFEYFLSLILKVKTTNNVSTIKIERKKMK